MTAGLITKIVDNLQISLQNLHLRIENEDTIEPDNSFSLGITLQGIDLYTTDENWQRIYVDRTKGLNRGKAMHKMLKIQNLGVYYKTAERSLISQAADDERQAFLTTFNNYDESGRAIKQADDYLIIPLRLEVKLTQNDPQTALDSALPLMNLSVGLEEFGITIQKGQYDNVQMLLELWSDYMRFLTTDQLRARKNNFVAMKELLEQMGHEASTRNRKALYAEIFARQLELIATSNPKKPEKLMAALDSDLATHGSHQIYQAIVLGTNAADLELWAKEVVTEKVSTIKREEQLKKQAKSEKKGFFSRVFRKQASEEVTEEEKGDQLLRIEQEIQEHASKMTAISGNQIARKNVPDITFDFSLH